MARRFLGLASMTLSATIGAPWSTLSLMPRPVAALALVALAVAPLAACSDDGRELAPIRPGQTTTTAPEVTVTGDAVAAFTLFSEAFLDGDPLPERFTCTSSLGGVSPPLAWSDIPPSIELALVVRDRDADGFVHWIVTGIDPVVSGFGEAGVPEGAVEQANSTGAIGWLSACPPDGDERHAYDFVLHSLEAPLDVDPGLPAAEVATMIEEASPNEARLTGTVTPPPG
jgi:Raf kinase inhibitor-like YbhB/YbcL family protein